MPEPTYHMRLRGREITDQDEMRSILSTHDFVTLAMCKDNSPYLVTVNHVYDPESNCVYFHCANAGKKLDYLDANPVVWGQALEDRGYVEGECDYDYRTVQFKGKARPVTDLSEKRRALEMMIEKMEESPEQAKKKFIKASSLDKVSVYRIDIEHMSGKKRVE